MVWLSAVLAAIVLVVVLALAIPVRLEVFVELTDRLRGRVRLRWWFAVVNVTSGPARAEQRAAAAKTSRPAAPTRRGRAAVAAFRTDGLMPRVARLLRDLLGRIEVRRFQLRARYGLGDPADTGQLCGALAPLLAMAAARGLDVRCRPEFSDAVIDGTCSGTIVVRPLAVLAEVAVFLCSPPVWRAARVWRRLT